MPKTFNLEIVNVVTSNKFLSDKYSLIFKDELTIAKVYGKKNQLIMDAVDNELKIFEKSNKKIYSNAIFSLCSKLFSNHHCLFMEARINIFLDNKAFDLIFFFSMVIQERLNHFLMNNQISIFFENWKSWIKNERKVS